MFDEHMKLDGFGIMPTIFGFPTYTLFVGMGIIIGLIYYLRDADRRHAESEGVIEIVAAGIIFGYLGSKIPLILEGMSLVNILYGKSIVGALLGGMLGVVLIKRIKGIKTRMGNIIAPAIALGMSIGRFGCFFNGCCYGKPASWGFDFGDGILRYPTQLFEVAFHLLAFLLLHQMKEKVKVPGILFKIYLLTYLTFRFFIEFIRVNKIVLWHMTVYQLLCIGGIILIAFRIGLSERSMKYGR